MSAFMVPVYIILIGAIMIVTIVAITQAKEFVLKKEQIKADALVRTEEINAKNRLEIEQLMYKNHSTSANVNSGRDADSLDSQGMPRNKAKY